MIPAQPPAIVAAASESGYTIPPQESVDAFIADYLDREARFFAIARDRRTKLTFDGYAVDPVTGQALAPRRISAPSKESLDLAILVKAIEGHAMALRLVSKTDAVAILRGKMDSYEAWYRDNPGYGGFLPWFAHGPPLTPAWDWHGDVPGLDNGEWAWAMLVAERALRNAGEKAEADRWHRYVERLRVNAVRMFYDVSARKVRADVHVVDPSSASSAFETNHNKPGRLDYLTGEHAVHEGGMMVLFVTLLGRGLPEGAAHRIWSDVRMKRVEHEYGTTWQGYWGSAHESWAWLFLPYRDLPEYRQLFRIREVIRTRNAFHRGYPGLATSCLGPAPPGVDGGYLSASGIEGVGSQPITNNHTFAIYGAFPLLLEFSGRTEGNVGLAWLVNMLRAPHQYGPLGGGESGTNDGTKTCYMKTIDGSFPNLIALMGGLESETAATLKDLGAYDAFIARARAEYAEAFGTEPLREPCTFALPPRAVPAP